MITRITSATEPLVSDYVGLTDVALRRVSEPQGGLFVAEGDTVIRRALAAGYHPRSLLMSERWLESLGDVITQFADIEVFVATPEVLEQITGFNVHRGALASMHRPTLPTLSALLATARTVVVLEDIVDHTNVGAVFRSAAALSVDAIVISPRCADPLYRRSVKVSMGTVFAVPWTRAVEWPQALAEIRSHGLTVMALTPTGATSIRDLDPVPSKWALLLGTEGTGLTDAALDACDLRVRIPMAGGVDSLNVAAAAAVACYALQQ